MTTIKTVGLVIAGFVVGFVLALTVASSQDGVTVGGVYNQVEKTFREGIQIGSSNQVSINSSGVAVMATTTVEAFTRGGQLCALTDANGGTYTLTDTEMATCGDFRFVAGGAGQATIALTFPATSTMTTTIPNAGDCRSWTYDASALAAATTTTMTAGTGHNIIAYTTNDDVIDGNEFSQITMCRRSDTDVNTFVTEMLHAD